MNRIGIQDGKVNVGDVRVPNIRYSHGKTNPNPCNRPARRISTNPGSKSGENRPEQYSSRQ
jgi:hypothetical protein